MTRLWIILLAVIVARPVAAEEFWKLDEAVEYAERTAADLYADYPEVETVQPKDGGTQTPDDVAVALPAAAIRPAGDAPGDTTILDNSPGELSVVFANLSERVGSGAIRTFTRDSAFRPALNMGGSLEAQMIAFIARHEAGAATYDSIWHGNRVPLPKPRLTQMTLCEVMEWQARAKTVQRSTAVGLFQIVSGTMRSVVDELGLDCNVRFGAELQETLGLALLRRRGWDAFKSGAMSVEAFAFELAGEWAAFPAPYGKNRGRSRYHGIADNRHQIELADYIGFLRGLREDSIPRVTSFQ